ncbi:ABC transporter substrate-binding protein [Blastococcus sp. SYSU DS0533]
MASTVRDVRTLRRLGVASAAVLALTLSACGGGDDEKSSADSGGQQGAQELTTVKIGLVPTVNTAMPHLAVEEHLGEEFGIDLQSTTIAGAGSTNQVAALLSGDLDVAIGGTNTVVDAIAEGADVKIIAGVGPLNFSVVLNKKVADGLDVDVEDDPEDRVKALKGLKIAVSPPGSTGNSVLRTILENAGLNPDRDVEMVPITDLGAIPAGLNSGQFDASFVAVGAGEVSVASGDAVLWLSVPKGDLEELNDFMGIVAFTSGRYAQANPDTIDAVHDTLVAAQEMTTEDPDEVAKVLKSTIFAELDQKVFDEVWSQVESAYPEGMSFTEDNWDTFVDLFDEASEKDYASLNYDDFVVKAARGNA